MNCMNWLRRGSDGELLLVDEPSVSVRGNYFISRISTAEEIF
jgi:hypothetical protein